MSASTSRSANPETPLIAGAFEVLGTQPMPHAGGGLPCFAVRDHRMGRHDLMAVQVAADAPARAVALNTLGLVTIEHLLLPLAHGVGLSPGGRPACFVILPKPPGDPLWPSHTPAQPRARIWNEGELLDCLLRPAALALDQLAAHGVTHRSIRPANVFQQRPGQPVTLGCAWAHPPAALQPCVFEPPYVAMCPAHARGEGTGADDIYALAVLIVALATGRLPLDGLDDEAIIRRKLERGCHGAICGDVRLPPLIGDLVRGMLADDPEHRPAPVALADPVAARGRRVATRPPQRAARAFEVGTMPVSETRSLAFALARAPDLAPRLLCGRSIDTWLRRTLGDPAIAARVDEVVRMRVDDMAIHPGRADAMLVLRAVAVLDPLAPLCWRGLSLFPDGLGTALAADPATPAGQANRADLLVEIIDSDAAVAWGEARPERSDLAALRLDSRQHRTLLRGGGWAGGVARLRYSLNSLLACRSARLGQRCVIRLAGVLQALDRDGDRNGRQEGGLLIDQDLAGFIAARMGERMDNDFAVLAQSEDPDIDPPGHRALAQLRILSRLAATEASGSWPRLAAGLLPTVTPALAVWKNRKTRARRQAALAVAAERGQLPAMLQALADDQAREADRTAAQRAEDDLRQMDRVLNRLRAGHGARTEQARATGQEIATALGMMALAISAIITVL